LKKLFHFYSKLVGLNLNKHVKENAWD